MAVLKTGLPLLVIAVGVACAAPVKKGAYLFHQDGPTTPVYLVSDHWHAGVVIKISDIPGDLVPESHDFPEADYLEFGWGDWDFYQAPRFPASSLPLPRPFWVQGVPGLHFSVFLFLILVHVVASDPRCLHRRLARDGILRVLPSQALLLSQAVVRKKYSDILPQTLQ